MKTHRILALVLAGTSLACAKSTDSQPPEFNGPARPVAIYAVDAGGLPDFLVWSADASLTDVGANPPPGYSRFRVEFNQLLNGATVAGNRNLVSSTSSLAASFCTPAAAAVSFKDVDDTAKPNRLVSASTCYVPSSGVGASPSIAIIPGSGDLAAGGAATNPMTCQAFTPAGTSQSLIPSHKYQLTLGSGITGANGGSFASPSGNGWDGAGNFTFTTDSPKIMAVLYNNSGNGTNYIAYKLPGFASGVPAGAPDQQVDCDFASTTATQLPCRVAPDNASPIRIIANVRLDPTSKSAVTLTRANGSSVDSVIKVPTLTRTSPLTGKEIRVSTGNAWEPNTQYLLTINSGIKSTTGLPVPPIAPYRFTAGSGQTAGSTNPLVQVAGVSPDVGSSDNSPSGTFPVQLFFSYPVDAATLAGVTVKDPTGAVVSDPAALAPKSAGQIVNVPLKSTLTTLKTGTVYTVSVTGAKVQSLTDLPAGIPGAQFPAFSSTFRTSDFHLQDIATVVPDPDPTQPPAITQVDGTRSVAPENLVDGTLEAEFNDLVTASTVTNSSLVLKENDVVVPATLTPDPANPDPGSNFVLKASDPGFKLKFNTRYTLTASTSIKDAQTPPNPLRKEACAEADCSQVLVFSTVAFVPNPTASNDTNPITFKSTRDGSFSMTFPYPVDNSLDGFLGGTAPQKMFALYKETEATDSVTGAITRLPDLTSSVGLTCNHSAPDTYSCVPKTPLAANARYLAIVTFYQATTPGVGGPVKVASPFMVGTRSYNFDTTTGAFFGVRTKELLTPCGP